MSTLKPAQKPPDQFDLVKLEQMVEPLSILIERVKGTTRSQIPMPAPEDGVTTPGTGLSKENVMGMEQWLVTSWAGGGAFIFTVNDSSSPPISMRWTAAYPIDKYPELVPPPLRPAARPVSAPVFPQVVSHMAAYPTGLPSVQPMMQMQPQPQHPQQPMYPPQPIYPAGWNDRMQSDFDRRNLEARIIEMEAKRFQEREDTLKREFEARLAAEKQAGKDALAGLTMLVESLKTKLETPNKNNEVEELKARLDNERREREAEKRDQTMRDQMRQQAESMQRMHEASQAQFQQMVTLMTQNQNKGPDPMFMMFMEQMKAQIEAQKEIARENRASLSQMQATQMSPRELIATIKDASASTDQVTRQVTEAMGNVVSFQAKVMEQHAQMNQTGGKTVIDLVDAGIERAAGLAERYAVAKSQEARAASQAQATTAMAQAQAVTAQAQAIEAQARAQSGEPPKTKPPEPTVHTPPPPKPQRELGGVNAGTSNNIANTNNNIIHQPPKRIVQGLPARTDAEWFTPQAMNDVTALRAGVSRLIESVNAKPPRMKDGKPDGVEAEQCASWILQAMNFAIVNNFPIPALVELLAEKRYADFMDVLLPDAPQAYRDDVIKLVAKQLEGTDDDEDEKDEPSGQAVGQAEHSTEEPQH